jgi:endonuclease/exonuclease/phosphatase family metal-dependent hydrolase
MSRVLITHRSKVGLAGGSTNGAIQSSTVCSGGTLGSPAVLGGGAVFKVMTWNVENLFRPAVGAGPPSQAVYDAKLNGLAATIDAQAPNALSVQEIGDPNALDDLVARLDGVWHTRVSQHPDHRGIRVAWLARGAITASEEITEFPAPLAAVQVDDQGDTIDVMGRGAVAITLQSDAGTPIRLVTAHLKSKLLTFPGNRFQPRDEDERARFAVYALDRRAAEAATLRVWATAALAGAGEDRPLILTGDLNDTEQAATTQLLLGPSGSEIETGGFDQPDRGDHQRLWNLAPIMPDGRNYSRINQGRKELIDHILVSAALIRPLAQVSAEAVIAQPLPSITADPNARRAAPSSDHAPVVATFENL